MGVVAAAGGAPLTALLIHNAPAVVYPLGRSRFLGQLLLGVWLAGLLSVAVWLLTSQRFDWRVATAFAVVLGAGAAAYASWRRQPTGDLHWDGAVWRWESASYQTGVVEQEIVVMADFQSSILLRLKNPASARLWLWPEKRTFPARWLDLRRAIYSTPKLPAAARHDVLPLAAVDSVITANPSVSGSLFPADSSKTEA